jgi:hypothetical protein
MANCANGLAFRLACEREAGSAIDRIDDGHVHARVLQRRIYRFAAQHRRGESVKLIRVGGAPGSALYTIAVGGSDREPTKKRHRTEHTQLTAVRQPPWRSTATDPTTTSSSGPAGVPTGKPQLGRHRPVHLRIAQFRLCRNDFQGRTAERANHVDVVACSCLTPHPSKTYGAAPKLQVNRPTTS